MKKVKQNTIIMIFIISFFNLCACDPITYPIPEEDPIVLTADAQSITTKIENLSSIMPQNPDTDKKINSTETDPQWSQIENDWITIYCEWTRNPEGKIKITVTENTSESERRYALGIKSIFKTSTLTIIQEGKNKENAENAPR